MTDSSFFDETILVITANNSRFDSICNILNTLHITRILREKNGIDGLKSLVSNHPELVLLDNDLTDGFSNHWIEKASRTQNPYCIVMAEPNMPATLKIQAVQAGACDIIESRFLHEELGKSLMKAKTRSARVSFLEMESEKVIRQNMDSLIRLFTAFVSTRTRAGQPVTDQDVRQFFPDADYTHIQPNVLVEAAIKNNFHQVISYATPTLLCVEDEPELQDIFHRVFSHCHVVSALSAEEALAHMKHQHFDTALVDIGLPGMQGDTLVGELKTLDPKLDIIVVTAFDNSPLIVNCFKRGAGNYIVKPFDIDELSEKVTEAYEKKILHYSLNKPLRYFERTYKPD